MNSVLQNAIPDNSPFFYRAPQARRPNGFYKILAKLPLRGSLTQADILLKYAQDLERHYKRQNLQPSRSLAADFTVLKQQVTCQQSKPLPKPTPTTTPSAKGKAAAVAGSMAGAAKLMFSLILVPPPPSGGKGMAMYGRARCMDDDFSAQFVPK